MIGGDWFGTVWDWGFVVVIVGMMGYGVLRSCEAGVDYGRKHIHFEWR